MYGGSATNMQSQAQNNSPQFPGEDSNQKDNSTLSQPQNIVPKNLFGESNNPAPQSEAQNLWKNDKSESVSKDLFGAPQTGSSLFDIKPSQNSIFGANNGQIPQQNIFGSSSLQAGNVFQSQQNQLAQPKTKESSSPNPLALFQSGNKNNNSGNNIFFDTKNNTSPSNNAQSNIQKNVSNQNSAQQDPANLFSAQNSSKQNKEDHLFGNKDTGLFGNKDTGLFGNKDAGLFGKEDISSLQAQTSNNQLSSSSSLQFNAPQNPFFNKESSDINQNKEKGQDEFLPASFPKQISPKRLEYSDQNQIQELSPEKNEKNSPLFGGGMSSISKDEDSDKISVVFGGKPEQKSQPEGNQDKRSVSENTIDNINLSEEDDLGLGDFSSKPFAGVQQPQRQQSRFESNRQEDEDDSNLKDFGSKTTKVREQDISIKKDHREFQKIDMQKRLVDLEIENDFLKKQIIQQKKTIQDYEAHIGLESQEHRRLLQQQKELFEVYKKQEEIKNVKNLENYTTLEKRFAFEMIRATILQTAERREKDMKINKVEEELQRLKIELNSSHYRLRELESVNKEFQRQQSNFNQQQHLQEQYSNFQNKLREILIQGNILEQIQDEEKLQQLQPSDQPMEVLDRIIADQFEQAVKQNVKLNQQKLENSSLLQESEFLLKTEQLKLINENEKLTLQVQQITIHCGRVEEELRALKAKVHDKENINYQNIKLNEGQKHYFSHQIEKEKEKIENLQKDKKRLQVVINLMAVVFTAFLVFRLVMNS